MDHPHWLRCSTEHGIMVLTLPYAGDKAVDSLNAAKEVLGYFSEHFFGDEEPQPIKNIMIFFEKEDGETKTKTK